LSSQTLEGHESALEPEALVTFFNAVARALARRGFFPKLLRTSLDSTGAEVVPTFAEAGVVKKKVKVQSKARRPRQVEVSVRGFKIWFLMKVETGLLLAMRTALPARCCCLTRVPGRNTVAAIGSCDADR
jgi:hypothetical protein